MRTRIQHSNADLIEHIWNESDTAENCHKLGGYTLRLPGEQARRGTPSLANDLSWRRYPRGFWVELSGTHILFDRDYCPIARIPIVGSISAIQPGERIHYAIERFFYEDANCPIMYPRTVDRIKNIALRAGLVEEIEYRVVISKGFGPDETEWTGKW